VTLDVERNTDYMRTPGNFAILMVGPFLFWLGTADGVRFGFGVVVRRRRIGWEFDTVEAR
jgi:hypothetical protein